MIIAMRSDIAGCDGNGQACILRSLSRENYLLV